MTWRRPSRAWRTYWISGLAILVFCGALALGVQRLQIQQQVVLESIRSGAWISSQAAMEHRKLLSALDRYAYGDPEIDRDTLLFRFDIFWSRVPLLVTGPEAVRLSTDPATRELVQDLERTLGELEPDIVSLQPGETAQFRRIRAALERFDDPLHGLMLAAMQDRNLILQIDEIQQSFRFVHLSYVVALAGGITVILLLLRATRKSQSLQEAFQQAAHSAEASRQHLNDALESISEGFVLFNKDDRLELCNSRFRELYGGIATKLRQGASLDELSKAAAAQGLTFHDLAQADSATRLVSGASQKQTETPEVRQSDGRWLRLEDRRTFDGGLVGIRTDVTDRKAAEEALRTSEEKYRSLVEDQPALICRYLPDTTLIFANKSYASFFGMEGQDLTGRSWFEWVPDEDRDKIFSYLASFTPDDPVRREEQALCDANGQPRWILWVDRAFFGEHGEIVSFQSMGTDVTERRRAEKAVRKSEEQLRLITDNLPVLISYLDREIRFKFINRACETWYGRRQADIIGKRVVEFLGESKFATFQPHIERVLAGEQVTFEAENTYPDGKTRDVAVSYVPHFDADAEVNGFFALSQDVTESKAMEQRLRRAQRLEAVGQLTGGVAHDFNNLLGVIIGNTEFLEDELGTDNEVVQEVKRAALRGAELTQRLLAYSRQQPLRPQVLELDKMVEGLTDMLRRTLGETIEIRTASAKDLWMAKGDPGQVENALLNLAINARDAMPRGGTLTIETTNVSLDSRYAASQYEVRPGDYVTLAVRDDGSGMSPRAKERAFEPFFTTKEVGKGSGLGLSMVYGFAKQSGGHVTIESEEGRGTTVKIYLPRATDAGQAEAGQTATQEAHPCGESILVVEDDEAMRRLVVSTLRALSYQVLEARDGTEARRIIEAGSQIDLLLSDVVLPGGVGGLQVVALGRERIAGLKVLLMTGYAESVIDPVSHPDCPIVITKPFRRDLLVEKVRALLDEAAEPSRRAAS